ncbi:tetratricopeptide repeat protein [Pseudoduganella sp. GCM10020061]|uniref:tetratricopeptide repeat protein n=1 Tax=Pseudoduganella sp. GCM10020061 TaxID=3317345 RepID=UPI003645DB58
MKTALAIVTLSALVSACAVAPQAPEAAAPKQAAPAAPAANSDLMYRVTKAEMEFREGRYEAAYLSMYAAAQQSRDARLAKRAAEMALAVRRLDDTMAAVRLWRELDPASEEAEQYQLALALQGNELDVVEQLLRDRIARADGDARGRALFEAQQLMSRSRDKKAGARVMERLAQPYAATFEGQIVLSQAMHTMGEREVAVTHANRALEMKPDSQLAALALAQSAGGDEASIAVLERFLKAHPNAREVRIAYSRALVERKDYAKARTELAKAVEDKPDDPAALYALGMLEMHLGDHVAAEKHLTRFVEALSYQPNEGRDLTRVYLMLAQAAEERGDFAKAESWLDKVDGEDAEAVLMAQLRRAQLLARKGDIKGARALLATLKPLGVEGQVQVALTEGQVLRDANMHKEAYELLRGAVARFPAEMDVLYDFALAAERAGHHAEMEKSLRTVIQKAPDAHHAYNALGYSLAERGVRLREARGLIAKAMAMAPEDPFIMDSMGWVEYRLGKKAEAERLLRGAWSRRKDPEIGVHLADVLWHAGKKEEARKILREVRTGDPKNEALRRMLARLKVRL